LKHATAMALDRLEPLLVKLRRHIELREKSRGVFYFKSRAVLHFHEDPKGLFADFRAREDWQRCAVNTAKEQAILLQAVDAFLSTA
jgi:hypothetical protein